MIKLKSALSVTRRQLVLSRCESTGSGSSQSSPAVGGNAAARAQGGSSTGASGAVDPGNRHFKARYSGSASTTAGVSADSGGSGAGGAGGAAAATSASQHTQHSHSYGDGSYPSSVDYAGQAVAAGSVGDGNHPAPDFLLQQVNGYLEGAQLRLCSRVASESEGTSSIGSSIGSSGGGSISQLQQLQETATLDAITTALGAMQDIVSGQPFPWPPNLFEIVMKSVQNIAASVPPITAAATGTATTAAAGMVASDSSGAAAADTNCYSNTSIDELDAAFEALVQVAVFMMANPLCTHSHKSDSACLPTPPATSTSHAMHARYLPQAVAPEADVRNKTAAILKGLAAASPKWGMMVCQEIAQVFADHFQELNRACADKTSRRPMDINLSLHDALPSMLSCLQTKATNPFGNGCMLATAYQQQHSSIGDSGSGGGGRFRSAASGVLRLSAAVEVAFPLLHFAIAKLRRAAGC